jgi:ribosomal peptide maturation radical SAM protein 1
MKNLVKNPRVLLITMPWAKVNTPSIQIGILKSSLKSKGIETDAAYLNIFFSKKIGHDLYAQLISKPSFSLLNEWLFNKLICNGSEKKFSEGSDYLSYLTKRLLKYEQQIGIKSGSNPLTNALGHEYPERLSLIKDMVIPEFMDESLCRINLDTYDIIGFTCTFSQAVPSVALARLIKTKTPNKFIIMGGASFAGEMGTEYMRVFPYIDCSVHGEGEDILPEVVQSFRKEGIFNKENASNIRGISWRCGDKIITNIPREPMADLDESPFPNYDDYFSQAAEAKMELLPKAVHFESARGCWWGEKKQCAFCGLNGDQLRFRSKSPARVMGELVYLAAKYQCLNFYAVDNVINVNFLKEFFPKLCELDLDITLFYETRVNLDKEQVRLLSNAGIKRVQAGIESFHSNILRLMRKGTSAIQNIQFLKWCMEFKIEVGYNLLWGFPGETPTHYKEMATTMSKLMHLQPPDYPPRRLALERFSPYFNNPDVFSIKNVQPPKDYQYIYPPDADLSKIAYVFKYSIDGYPTDLSYIKEITKVHKVWYDRYYSSERPLLFYIKGPDFVEIFDSRRLGLEHFTLEDVAADIYLFCDKIRSLDSIKKYILRKYKMSYTESDVNDILINLIEKNLIITEGNKFLCLALPKKSIELGCVPTL